MTTDPKDAEIARLNQQWENHDAAWSERVAALTAEIDRLTAELSEMTRRRDEWRNDFRALEKAIVGDTGLSAMTVAAQARLFRPRAEKAEAERDAALAQVAVLTEIASDSVEILQVAIDNWNDLYPDEPDEIITDLQSRCRAASNPTAALAARDRRDAQMRAEGRKEGLREAGDG